MLPITQDNIQAFRQTNRLICKECIKRGFEIRVPYSGSAHIYIKAETKWIHLYTSAPPDTSYAAAKVADNKYATHFLLKEANLPVLPTVIVRKKDDIAGLYDKLQEGVGRVVIKPVNGSHGDGITVGAEGIVELKKAVEHARGDSHTRAVLVQKIYENPIDIRILCIGYKFIAAVHRIPARVLGDGVHTVKELIELENQQPDRGVRYIARLGVIDIERAIKFLGNTIHDIPAKGQWLSVMAMANYGAGGETVNITDSIPVWLKEMAETAAKTVDLSLCGVDFLMTDLPTLNSYEQTLKPVITEINKSPSLFIHERPTNNEGDPVVASFIDYVLSLP